MMEVKYLRGITKTQSVRQDTKLFIHFHFLIDLLNRQHEIGSLRGELVCLILVYISRSLQDTVMCLRAMNT